MQGSSVLTIGETPDFIDAGGAVGLSFELETLHFEVNLRAAKDAHLKISSGMLALARRVPTYQDVLAHKIVHKTSQRRRKDGRLIEIHGVPVLIDGNPRESRTPWLGFNRRGEVRPLFPLAASAPSSAA